MNPAEVGTVEVGVEIVNPVVKVVTVMVKMSVLVFVTVSIIH